MNSASPLPAGKPLPLEGTGEREEPELDAVLTAPINILLVDDEPKNLTALEIVLNDPGYRLVRASSADEALLALVQEEFAVLVLDIQMPGMNGFELAQLIKRRRKTASVPIIFLTAYYGEDEHVLEGYSTGAVDYLHKPINAVVLRSKVAIFAELHRRTRESALANHKLLAEVAERRHAQEQLRELNSELENRVALRTAAVSESEARFRALAEDMPHLVWETDTRGRTTFQNAKWRTYTGHGTEPSGEAWKEAIHPNDAPSMAEAWTISLQTGTECDTYCRYRRASDGTYRWFRVKAAPVRDGAGKVVRWVGTCTDIHEQRKAEEALSHADRRKDEFLAMLGHELRNPLSAIRHAVRIDEEAGDDPEAHRWASEVIDRQSAQLTRMVDDLLDVERINRGRIELRSELVDLGAVLARAQEAVQPLILAKRHTLHLDGNGELHVQGDAARLQQVFVNLFSNAAKYTSEGGTIQVQVRRAADEAVVSVADNGVGLSAEVLPRVFDLFTQAHTSIDRAQGGLGIGLTVVKSLIEMHGGSVVAQSDGPSRGSTFIIRLPLAAEPPTQGQAAVTPPERGANQSGRVSRPLRVLIVDDHRDAAETLSRLLVRRGCVVRLAHDGVQGLEAAGEFHPEVLLLDLGLPGLDGYELCRTLRAQAELAGARFVAISGYAQKSDVERALASGFDLHFAKPVDFPALLEVLLPKAAPAG